MILVSAVLRWFSTQPLSWFPVHKAKLVPSSCEITVRAGTLFIVIVAKLDVAVGVMLLRLVFNRWRWLDRSVWITTKKHQKYFNYSIITCRHCAS